jgi:hypothetical protein
METTMIRTVQPTLILAAALVALACPTTGFSQQVTLEAIREAWTARQEKCKTVRVAWSSQIVVPKGHFTYIALALDPKDQGPYPPNDATLDSNHEMLLDGEQYWIRRTGQAWCAQQKQFKKVEDEHYLSKTKQVKYSTLSEGRFHREANIHKTDYKLPELEVSAHFPVLCAVRGAFGREPFGDILSAYELTSRTATIGGRTCVELVQRSRTQETVDSLWLDPKRDMALVRRVKLHKSNVTHQLDITLEEHRGIGWLPKAWKSVSMRPEGSLFESMSCTLTSIEAGITTVPGDFDPVFSPGTHVIDRTEKNSTEFVVQPDGEEGGRIPTRQLPTYEQLAATPSPSRTVWPYLASGMATLAVLVAGVWVWNRFIRRKQSGPPMGQQS